MRIECCGWVAINKLKTIEKISAYSLIQVAKENGVNLLIYQVEPKDLMLVPRPVIIHTKDHFIYVKNGEVLPKYEYTGFVMSEKGFKGSRIVPYTEAKKILGSKKGGVLKNIVPVVAAVVLQFVGVPAPLTAAVANVGMDQYAKSQHPEQLGAPGNPLDIAGAAIVGGLEGYGAGQAVQGGIAGGTQAGPGFLSKASGIAKGAIVGTPASVGGANVTSQGVNVGATYTPATSGLLGKGGSLLGAGNSASQLAQNSWPSATSSSMPAMSLTSGGVGNVYGQSLPGAIASGSPAMSLASGGVGNSAGYSLNPVDVASYVNSPTATSALNNIGKTAANVATGGNLLNSAGNLLGLGQGDLARGAIGLATSGIGKPDTSYLDNGVQNVSNDYSALKTYIGNNAMPQATQDELMTYIHTPIDQLTTQLASTNQPVINQINIAFDRQIQQLQRQYVSAGQSPTTSSDFRDQVQKINNDRAQQIQNASLELQNQNLGKAIQAKQFALSQGMAQGQFDSNLAFELANVAGQQKELKLAIDTQNYNQFQSIMANLLNEGFANQYQTKYLQGLKSIYSGGA